MTPRKRILALALAAAVAVGALAPAWGGEAARVFLPAMRFAYRQDEPIEVAIHTRGLPEPRELALRAEPGSVRLATVRAPAGEGTASVTLAPNALRPGSYTVTADLEGVREAKLEVGPALSPTRFFTGGTGRETVASHNVSGYFGNVFGSAWLDSRGEDEWAMLSPEPLRPHRAFRVFEDAVRDGISAMCYLYWSGYITHKPWNVNNSWSDPDIVVLTQHVTALTAQRLRRFPNVWSVSPFDEPGLAWSLDRDGRMATLWPNDYQRRQFTAETGIPMPADIAKMSDAHFLAYLRWRCGIMGRVYDLSKALWRDIAPDFTWSPNIYAGETVNDGAYPLNGRGSDLLSTHSFSDWHGGKQIMGYHCNLERAAGRDKKVFFGVNGLLHFDPIPEDPVPYEVRTNYLLCQNLAGVWYLNHGAAAKAKTLVPLHTRCRRLGDFFWNVHPATPPVAILFSISETGLAFKDRIAQPDHGPADCYRIKERIGLGNSALWSALYRAGYPCDVVIEEEVAEGGLEGRQALWLTMLEHETLPPAVVAAIRRFQSRGGVVLLDKLSAPMAKRFPGAVATEVDFSTFTQYTGEAWKLPKDTPPAKRTLMQGNEYQEQPIDAAVPALKEIMRKAVGPPLVACSRPRLVPHVLRGGQATFYAVVNDVRDRPEQPSHRDKEGNPVYRPHYFTEVPGATVTLNEAGAGDTLLCLGGRQWDRRRDLSAIEALPPKIPCDFDLGEMKLFVALPEKPRQLSTRVGAVDEGIALSVQLVGASGRELPVVLPLDITVAAPDGSQRYRIYRATDAQGRYAETLPLASNDPDGSYAVTVSEPFTGLEAEGAAAWTPSPVEARPIPQVVILDGKATNLFLTTRRPIYVVVGDKATAAERQAAQRIATRFRQAGWEVASRAEGEVMTKSPRHKYFTAYKPITEKYTDEQGRERERIVGWEHWKPGEKQALKKPWEKLEVYVGALDYKPMPPDCYDVPRDIVLVGTDQTSLLVRALQRGCILERVATSIYPGKGRGLLAYAWSPFSFGKDVVLVTGSDVQGVAKAAQTLAPDIEY
ncbi:MAG: hypothetical protein ACLF0G_07540 [Candidatus Brocadiia bacterium]